MRAEIFENKKILIELWQLFWEARSSICMTNYRKSLKFTSLCQWRIISSKFAHNICMQGLRIYNDGITLAKAFLILCLFICLKVKRKCGGKHLLNELLKYKMSYVDHHKFSGCIRSPRASDSFIHLLRLLIFSENGNFKQWDCSPLCINILVEKYVFNYYEAYKIHC